MNAEAVFIEMFKCGCFGGQTAIIGCIYRPPDNDIDIFNEALSSMLEIMSDKNRTCVLLGEFNINLLKHESNSSIEFLNTLYSYYFDPLIDKPTRITCSSATLIDNILTNHFVNSITSGMMLTDISDHLPVFLFFLCKEKPTYSMKHCRLLNMLSLLKGHWLRYHGMRSSDIRMPKRLVRHL